MPGSDLLHQPFNIQVKGVLEKRKRMHQQMVAGAKDPTGNYKKRYPAWARVSINGGPTIETKKVDFIGRYDQNTLRPITPSLKKLTIKRLTASAERLNLTVEVDIEFEVYTYEQFEQYSANYLRRRADWEPITIEWGFLDDYNERAQTSNVLRGARILAGGWSITERNTWICTCRAIAPAASLFRFDVMSHVSISSLGLSNFLVEEGFFNREAGKEVTSLPQVIVYDCQESGDRQ